jgi:ribosomal protein S18 acetylase RimI-like enzyme
VADEFRGQGVATQLLDHVEQVARLQGASALECLTSETDNVPAFSCFIRLGFVKVEPAGRYPHGQQAVRLRRLL